MESEEITIKKAQQMVDNWIKEIGGGYFSELGQLAQLIEEVGEVAMVISRTYGEQSFKESDKDKDLAGEMADVLFALICIANSTGVDLASALKSNIKKKKIRDKDRHQNNEKLHG